MDKLELTKKAISSVVGLSTSFAVGALIRQNTQPATTIQKVEVEIAAFAVGYLVADYVQAYTIREVDKAASWWTENVTNKSK